MFISLFHYHLALLRKGTYLQVTFYPCLFSALRTSVFHYKYIYISRCIWTMQYPGNISRPTGGFYCPNGRLLGSPWSWLGVWHPMAFVALLQLPPPWPTIHRRPLQWCWLQRSRQNFSRDMIDHRNRGVAYIHCAASANNKLQCTNLG